MKKTRVNKTAQVNLMMLADLGIEEAVHFQEVFGFSESSVAWVGDSTPPNNK